MNLREALPSEVDTLNHFIRASKAVWGYSDDFLNEFIDRWGLSTESLENKPVKIVEENGLIYGVFCLAPNDKKNIELDLFFVNSHYIKTGIGRKMWAMVNDYARLKKWKTFELIADPNSEAFYLHMGAKTVGTFESFPGRFVPIMKVEL